MKFATLALSILAGIATGCATGPPSIPVATSDLPDCFAANYDAQMDLFTIRGGEQNPANQQCALTVGPGNGISSASRIGAGKYSISLSNGGGGGAGGTWQGTRGGGGGGGAGAREVQSTVDLTEGVYRLTIGAGGPGGDACVLAPYYLGGGPGWLGSPSNIVRVATGDVIAGTPGAGSYARPSRAQHDLASRKIDGGNGGSGPGQTSGGHGGSSASATRGGIQAESGQSSRGASGSGAGGIPGGNEDRSSAGGGGGATSRADGGGGGGELPGHPNLAPQRGSLGSGGGGGEGSTSECDAGGRGGHGFIALRPI